MRGPHYLLIQGLKHRTLFPAAFHEQSQIALIDCNFAFGPHFCEHFNLFDRPLASEITFELL